MTPSILRRHLAGVAWLSGTLALAGGAAAQDAPSDDSPAADEKPGASDSSDAPSEHEDHDSEAPSDASKGEHSTAEASASADVAQDLGAPSDRPFRRLWVGVAGSLDLAFLGQGSDVCKLSPVGSPPASPGTYCTTPTGTDFPSRTVPVENDALIPGHSGDVGGGVKVGDVRALVAVDYAVTPQILVGARIGVVMNSYAGTAAVGGRPVFLRQLHLEARGTYVFGKDPLLRVGFAPMAFLGAGVAAVDGHALTHVSFAGVRGQTPINVWRVSGPGLLSLGGGTRYAFSPRAAFSAAWKFNLGFGNSTLVSTGPEIAFQYGF